MRVRAMLGFARSTLLAVATLIVVFPACSAEIKPTKGTSPVITYPIGRFELDMPKTFSLAVQSQRIRYAQIIEVPWPKGALHELARQQLWDARIAEIKKLDPPEGRSDVVIETRDFPDVGELTKGVFYFGSDMTDTSANWDVLLDTRPVGVWLKSDRSKVTPQGIEKMIRNLTNIARAYRSGDPLSQGIKGDWFYTQHGAINLPYMEQEKTYARFENESLGLTLEFDTTETHKDEVKGHGLLGRLDAVIESGFAGGVKMDHVRKRTRTLAGLDGEELVLRAHDGETTRLSFTWRFSGKKDSGQQPKIVVDMESPDGQLEEKLKIWDAILDSFKPVGP